MKRILSLGLAILMLTLGLTGCGEKDRILYKSVNLDKFVELADYKNIKVDTASDEFKKVYDQLIVYDIIQNDFREETSVTEGAISYGDMANIDYEGKKDGVAFEGGAAKGHDLEIGSNSFIDGFEEGLIGVEIGSTVDLNLTFPENYQSTDLAGKAVVFTVKVNSAKKAKKPEDFYTELGHKTVEEYYSQKNDTALNEYLLNEFIEKSSVKNYPEADIEILKEKFADIMEKNLQSTYGMTLADYISQTGSTQESFNKQLLDEQVYPLMSENMPLYAILDEEKVEVTTADTSNMIKKMVDEYGKNSGVTEEKLKEYYGEYYFENILVSEKAVEILKKYADIK